MDDQFYRDLIDGKRRGPGTALLRALLYGLSVPYHFGVRARNYAFDRGLRRIERAEVPVISVGNLTLGGTGKTPMVEYLARWLRDRGLRVCILSRGYKAQCSQGNDEARVLQQNLPDVPHLQDPDRVSAARRAVEEHQAQVLVLDDGFQHRRLARDLDVVLLDALDPFGSGHIFPRGTLREPLSALRRADLLILSRADLCLPEVREQIQSLAHRFRRPLVEVRQSPTALLDYRGKSRETDHLRGRRVAAFCGIGNPDGFRRTLETIGYSVAGFRTFADHHYYCAGDLQSLAQWAGAMNVAAVVTTQKDLVKLDTGTLETVPLWAVAIRTEIICGTGCLHERLKAIAKAAAMRRTDTQHPHTHKPFNHKLKGANDLPGGTNPPAK